MDVITKLGWPDYLIWIVMVITSFGIGIVFGIIEKRRSKTDIGDATKEFLLGGRKMSCFPVSCSLLASFFSAITLLGTPNEVYQNGVMYWLIGLGFTWQMLVSIIFFIPVFYNLDFTSSYEYLGLRFSKTNQVMGACAFISQMVPYLGIVMYGPSLALGILININIWIPLVVMAIVCTIYTAVGGIKGVVWTDVLQLLMMFVGLVSIIIKGSIDAGGFGNVWRTAKANQRLDIDFSFDPRHRHTLWSVIIGGGFTWLSIYAINQTMIQRVVSVKTEKQAYIAYLLNIPGLNLLLVLVVFCGLVVFYDNYGCDPISSGSVSKSDQILPYFVSKHLTQYPAVAGIFVAGIFSGGLSTMSSGLNSLAAVTLHDIIMVRYPKIPDHRAVVITRCLVCFFGSVALLFAYIGSLTDKILEAALGLFGMCSGPVLGVFTLGIFFPFTNRIGAITGHIVSQILIFWIGFGAFLNSLKHPRLPVYNFNCSVSLNLTNIFDEQITTQGRPLQGVENLYAVSYIWYSMISCFIVLLLGIPISLVTKSYTEKPLNSRFITPLLRRMWRDYLYTDEIDGRNKSEYKITRRRTIEVSENEEGISKF